MTISRFVSPYGTYTFPTVPGDQDFRTNFKDLVARTTRLPGVSGGYDEHGSGRAPSEIGNVQFSIFLTSDTRAGMQALRDALNRMADWGVGVLYDTINGVDRWCYARVNNITITEDRHKHTDLHQKVQLSFQVSDPFWYTAGNTFVWDSGILWDGANQYWDLQTGTSVTTSGTISITNNGSAFTLPRIFVNNTSGSGVTDLRIERVVNGLAVDDMRYTTTLATGTYLDIDTQRKRVSIGAVGTNAYANFSARSADWLRLLPGANSLRVTLLGTVTVYVQYMERYT